jgi:hypothetical protein
MHDPLAASARCAIRAHPSTRVSASYSM